MKPDSNYNQGMKPLIYSEKEAEEHQFGWQRDGFNISYYQGARKKRVNGGAGGVLGSLASASTATSAYSASNAPTSCTGYGPVYYALTFEIMFKCKYVTIFPAILQPLTAISR